MNGSKIFRILEIVLLALTVAFAIGFARAIISETNHVEMPNITPAVVSSIVAIFVVYRKIEKRTIDVVRT
jgi:hypothetical protein